MASRLNMKGAYTRVVEESEPTPAVEHVVRKPHDPVVTSDMVDAAVDKVFGDMDLSDADKLTLRRIMSLDDSTEFAHALHSSVLRTRNVYSKLKKRKLVIHYVLDQSETTDLVAYAPEFDFTFTDTVSHDHGMAAALRVVDSEIIMSQLPEGIAVKDVGGRPLYHVSRGSASSNVHVCNPIADAKDPSRMVTRRLAARRILQKTKDDDVAALASKFLEDDPSFICHELSQDCTHKARITMSSHVYDVPLEKWPEIMGMANASVHLGVMSYPTQALESSEGKLPVMRARYKLDLRKDAYFMGFENSPSWWYTHKWSKYMRYASDQEIVCNGRRYSYKVVERRGDSIFFRVMRLSGSCPEGFKQFYAVPGVKMVKVDGFSYDMSASYRTVAGTKLHARPHSTLFPARLWEDMLAEAMLRFEKGDFTYDKMYNYYRTVSARHTINGVLISGGQKVGMMQVVDLVVRSGLCAAAKVMLEQRTSRSVTSRAMDERQWFASSTVSKMLSSFFKVLKTVAAGLLYYPFVWLCDKFLQKFSSFALDELASWEFQPEIKLYPFSSVLTSDVRSQHYSWALDSVPVTDDFSRGYISENTEADHDRMVATHPDLAKTVLESLGLELTGSKRSEVAQAAFAWSDSAGNMVSDSSTLVASDEDEIMRRNAIQERIDEGVLERQKISGICQKIMRACISEDGTANASLLKQRSEEYDQPDIWFVSNGVLQKSALGVKGVECKHSAVYTLSSEAGSNFRVIRDEEVDGEDYRVLTTPYTGMALTTDRMLIFNGPEIEKTLELAMRASHRYVVALQQGPPGCGKTTSLVANMTHSQVAMCPVRESAGDTRLKLSKKDPTFPDVKHRVSTIHSYLCNYTKPNKIRLKADCLQADEVYMTHSGEWYAVAALLGVNKIMAYGDINQIPHIPRVQASKMYLRVASNMSKYAYAIYRCPADALAAWGDIYDWKVRTYSKVRKSMSVVTSYEDKPIPDGCVFMCMYQEGKRELKKKFASILASKHIKIMTVNESEGKDFDDVWLFRFDVRVRTDAGSLYDRTEYVLVAMSRHRKTFVYVRPRNLGDAVDKRVAKSQDERCIAAMADTDSLGICMQFM